MSTTERDGLEKSIKKAEYDIRMCQSILGEIEPVPEPHRNFLGHFTKEPRRWDSYFEENNPAYQDLEKRAKSIQEEQSALYDKVAQRYFDPKKIIADIEQSGTDDRIHTEIKDKLEHQGILRAVDLLNYATLIMNNEDDPFKRIGQVTTEYHTDPEFFESVRKEKALFEDYITLCKQKLDER